ncbi:hypothetical protein LguiB_018366 [Lonicera macranthoides]
MGTKMRATGFGEKLGVVRHQRRDWICDDPSSDPSKILSALGGSTLAPTSDFHDRSWKGHDRSWSSRGVPEWFMIDHGGPMIDHGSPESPCDSKEGRLLPPMGEKALNRARENEVGDSAGGCVCPQRRAHSRYLAFQLDYVSLVRRVSPESGVGPVCHYFPNGESPGSSWATNGHHLLGYRLV